MGKVLPEHVLTNAKTGLRVGIGLLALSLIQFNARGPANNPSSGAYNWLHTAVQWASVTLVLIQTPETLGGSVWLSLQRILGTLVGGFVAFGLVVGVSNGVALAFCGMAVAMLAAFTKVGQFNRFGGFVVITWCIVAMQGFYFDSTSMLLLQAGVRVIGIIVGVLIGLAASILILPDSAFGQAVQITRGTLAASITLHDLAWQNLKPKVADPEEVVVIGKSNESDHVRTDTHDEETMGNGDAAEHQNTARGSHMQQCGHWISGSVHAVICFLTEGVGSSRASAGEHTDSTQGITLAFDQALWDEELNKCSVGLTSYRAAIADAASELYVGTDCLGHRWFLPTLKWPQFLTWAMPKDELKATRTAARKLRQSVYGIHHLLLEGFDFSLLQVAQQRQMLQEVGATSKAALAACLDAFPGADLAVTDWPAAAVMRAALDAIDALVQHAALASPEMLAHLAEQRQQQPPSPRKSVNAALNSAMPPRKPGGATPRHESGSIGRAPAAHSPSSSSDGSSVGVGDVPVLESWATNSQRLLQAARHSGSLHSRRASGSGSRQCTAAASATGTAAIALPGKSPNAVPSGPCSAEWPRGQPQGYCTLQQAHCSHGLHAIEGPTGRPSSSPAADEEGSPAKPSPTPPDPQQLQAYIAQVRWNGLIVGVVTLADAMVSLLHSINALLPLLPGSPLRRQQAPDTVELQEWPSCFAVWGILHSSFQNEPSAAAEERSASATHWPADPGLGL